jgi:hypothetical protein
MARARRVPDDLGRFTCTKCKELKHITEFYQQGGARWCIRNRETGIDEWFGKPMSWCIACTAEYNKAQRQADKDRQALLEGNLTIPEPEPVDYSTPYVPERIGPPEPEPEVDDGRPSWDELQTLMDHKRES